MRPASTGQSSISGDRQSRSSDQLSGNVKQRPGQNPEYREWMRTVTTKMPHLSKPQAVVLAMWSFGMVMTGCCGLSTVAVFLALVLGKKENTVRQQLREWYKDKRDKKGKKRASLDVTTCFAPLLAWILSWWPAESKCLALALDPTTLGQKFTVLVVSVVYRGCGIPVAWKVVKATEKGSWQPYWLELLKKLENTVPPDWLVVVTADRGLYAKWLYDKIEGLGWHPFLRINHQGLVHLNRNRGFTPLADVVKQPGQSFSERVTCFKTHSLDCTLLVRWELGSAEPWLIVTDLEPFQADACWYSMRSWIECLFQDTKRGGWQWHQTKMTDPQRAQRHWLAIALATLWLVSVGGQADANLPPSSLEELPETHPARQQASSPPSPGPRLLSCFRRGFLVILAALLNGLPLPLGSFFPESFSGVPNFSSA